MSSSPPRVSARSTAQAAETRSGVIGALSVLDRFLPVWIVTSMVAGLLLGRLVPGLDMALEAVKVGEISLPSRSACC